MEVRYWLKNKWPDEASSVPLIKKLTHKSLSDIEKTKGKIPS